MVPKVELREVEFAKCTVCGGTFDMPDGFRRHTFIMDLVDERHESFVPVLMKADVDPLVLFDGKKRYSRCFDLKAEIERELARPVDMLTTPQGAQPYFLDEVERDMVSVYER